MHVLQEVQDPQPQLYDPRSIIEASYLRIRKSGVEIFGEKCQQ